MSLEDEARTELADLEARNLRRTERVLESAQGPVIRIGGRELISFGSNDYLGLASDPRLVSALVEGAERAGVGAGASRLIVGTHSFHVELERAVADWLQVESVRTFSSGYAANVGVLTTLLRPGDVVFSDELNHASVIDGCRLSKATIRVYPHLDLNTLERELAVHPGRRRLVVSESLFSMNGDIPDLEKLRAICDRAEAVLMVDEAHALGVFGPEGRGLAAEVGVRPEVLIGTFGKALGTSGAFMATSRAVGELIWNRARSFVFSTGAPAAVAAATLGSLELVRGGEGDARRQRLEQLGHQLRAAGRFGGDVRSPISPFVVGDEQPCVELSQRLEQAGVFIPAIRPPTVPHGNAMLRLSLSAAHSDAQLQQVTDLLSTS